jgi:hypothetical protein
MVYADLRLPEAGLDGKIGKLRKQAQRPEQYKGCSALTHEVRVVPKLHENPLRAPWLVQPPKNSTSLELCPARRGLLANHGSLKSEFCSESRLFGHNGQKLIAACVMDVYPGLPLNDLRRSGLGGLPG